jgi:hypothetical protein
MPHTLDPIPSNASISTASGIITNFFRLRWEALRTAFGLVPTRAIVRITTPINAALGVTNLYVATTGGQYRVSWYVRKTTPDGVNSSLTVTLGWVQDGIALNFVGPALLLDSALAVQSGSFVMEHDTTAALTGSIAYASNTPGNMAYKYTFVVEQMA